MKTEGPPSFQAFLLERAFWTEMGLRREDLENRPYREVADYITYLNMVLRDRQAQQTQQAGGSSGGKR